MNRIFVPVYGVVCDSRQLLFFLWAIPDNMGIMKKLADRIKRFQTRLEECTRCGMCQSVCPVFGVTGMEADVARGKLALVDGLMHNMFSDPDGVEKRLNKCLLCGACQVNCPSGVTTLEIFIKARAIITEYKGLSSVKKLVLRKLLAEPGRFDSIALYAEKFQMVLTKKEDNFQGTSCARLVSPLLRDRHFMPLAPVPFHRSLPSLDTIRKNRGPKVIFFTGCLIDKILPGIAHACIKVFAHHGAVVYIPQDQGCCGIPALSSGDMKTFNHLVEHHVKLFSAQSFDYIVTACATCTSTIRKLWPVFYSGSSDVCTRFVQELGSRTLDINQFLVDVVKMDEDRQDVHGQKVTYHDPCHLKKSLGVASEPRAVIRAAGMDLVEMKDADKCCGMGGSFNLLHYDISMDIGKLKYENIVETGCSCIATGCPACMMQISDILAKNRAKIRVAHPVELYAGSLEDSS